MKKYDVGAEEFLELLDATRSERERSDLEKEFFDAVVETAAEMNRTGFMISTGHFLWVEGLVYRALRTRDDEDAEMALRALADVHEGNLVQIVKIVRERLD